MWIYLQSEPRLWTVGFYDFMESGMQTLTTHQEKKLQKE